MLYGIGKNSSFVTERKGLRLWLDLIYWLKNGEGEGWMCVCVGRVHMCVLCVCVFGWWGDVGVDAAEGETNHCDKLRSKLDEREESVSGQLVLEQY